MNMPMKKRRGPQLEPGLGRASRDTDDSAGPGRVELDHRGGASDTGRPVGGQRRDAAGQGEHVRRQAGRRPGGVSDLRRPGSQSVGQMVGMLGQLGQQAGQMGQMAGAPAQAAGQGAGMFGSLIQQAMQAAQGGGGGGQSADGQNPAGSPVQVRRRPLRPRSRRCRCTGRWHAQSGGRCRSAAARRRRCRAENRSARRSFEPTTGTSTRDPASRCSEPTTVRRPARPDLSTASRARARPRWHRRSIRATPATTISAAGYSAIAATAGPAGGSARAQAGLRCRAPVRCSWILRVRPAVREVRGPGAVGVRDRRSATAGVILLSDPACRRLGCRPTRRTATLPGRPAERPA